VSSDTAAYRGRDEDVPLSIEPVIGWRVWRLVRRQGVLTLTAMTAQEPWPPKEVMHAICRRAAHPAPAPICTCGLYAAGSPKDLAHAGVYGYADVCVVGAIAMWGTVVEHQRGARSSNAYPARLALVCGPCLRVGLVTNPSVVVGDPGPLTALCQSHQGRQRRSGRPAKEIQAELLDTYGVEPLPRSRIARRPLRPQVSPVRMVEIAVNVVVGLFKLAFFLFMAPIVLGGLLFLLALFLQVVTLGRFGQGPVEPAVSPPAVVAGADALRPDTPAAPEPSAASPMRGMATSHTRSLTRPPPEIAVVCGIGRGHSVEIVPCADRSSDIVGLAQRSSPHGPEADCIDMTDAYSRGAHYWVCWTTFEHADVRPWASTPNPFLIPVSEGGAAHGDR